MSDQHALQPDAIPPDEDDSVHLATEGIPEKVASPDPAAFDESVEVVDEDVDA